MGAVIEPEIKSEILPYIESNFGKISEREMSRRLHIGKTTVNRWRKDIGLKIKKNTVNDIFFKTWNPEMAYILGYIFADGNINWNLKKSYRALTITASKKDVNHLEKIRQKIQSTKQLLYSTNTESFRLIVNNVNICKDLMRKGVIPNKSLTVEFPKVPGKFLRHFIRGVVDGDGNVRFVNRKKSPYFEITISSGSKKFLEKIAEEIKIIGINARVRKVGENVFVLQYSCKKGLKLAKWIYDNENMHLERKFEQYKLALNVHGGE